MEMTDAELTGAAWIGTVERRGGAATSPQLIRASRASRSDGGRGSRERGQTRRSDPVVRHSFIFGSSQSLSESPNRLNPNTASEMAMPG